MFSQVTPKHEYIQPIFNWLHRFLIAQSRLFFSNLAPVHYAKPFLDSTCCQKKCCTNYARTIDSVLIRENMGQRKPAF